MNRSPLVLIVDDARDNREAYVEYLQFCGFRTIQAATGQEALNATHSCHPDVVLLDLRLPDLEGVEVSRRLRSSTSVRRLTIIALSACVFQEDIASAIENGCDAFLAKPCLPDELVTEIGRLLNWSTTARAAIPLN